MSWAYLPQRGRAPGPNGEHHWPVGRGTDGLLLLAVQRGGVLFTGDDRPAAALATEV